MNEPHPTVLLWAQMSDPDATIREKAIRADQRRLDLRELQATARDLAWLLDRLEEKQGPTVTVSVEALDQIRRTTRKLITLAERRAAA